ncbi:hypothetical protein WJX81_000982 [Elliptochloris bilobata]|uniref:Uncharacterized protein n=1 Tax=Elliptochloris bilobata TaxID=381761 RepID=A0AAW1S7Z3_9CHLO
MRRQKAELVRAATEMESTMLAKLGPSLSQRPRSPADLQAVVEQVGRGILRVSLRRELLTIQKSFNL